MKQFLRIQALPKEKVTMTKLVFVLIVTCLLSACTYPKYVQEPAPQRHATHDSSITTHIKAALANDPILNAGKIHVNTNGGVVTLNGRVQTQSEISRAIQLANQTQGVKLVESNLIVVPPLK